MPWIVLHLLIHDFLISFFLFLTGKFRILEMEKVDKYLYMSDERYLFGLNLTNFLEGEASLEMSVNFEASKLSLGVGFFEINAELYCVGGERHRPNTPESDEESFDDLEFNFPDNKRIPLRDIENSPPSTLDIDEDLPEVDLHQPLNEDEYPFGLKAVNAHVYKFDRNYDPIIAKEIPPMNAGKVNVVTTQIDGKIYVLSQDPILSNIHPPLPTFEMYDSFQKLIQDIWSSFCFIVIFHKLVVHILQFLICLLS